MENKKEFPRLDTYLPGTILKVKYTEDYINEETLEEFDKEYEDLVVITEKDDIENIIAVSINSGDLWAKNYGVDILSIEVVREGRVKLEEDDN